MSTIFRDEAPLLSSDGPACPGHPVMERLQPRSVEVVPGFTVQRVLPNRGRRLVGAWCFLDHAGPVVHSDQQGSIGPHPHIGLQTFTWVIEGQILHRDSLGNAQLIRPAQVNLMTAASGIVHAEEGQPHAGGTHIVQLWIALPESARHGAPAFQHCPVLPRVALGGFDVTVLAGRALGLESPAQVFSPLVGLDVTSDRPTQATLELNPDFEHAVVCLSDSVEVEGETIAPGEMLYLGLDRHAITIRSDGPAHFLVIGGQPFGEDVLMWWNFVGRTAEEMTKATEDWNAGRYFGQVDSQLTRIPAPDLAGMRIRRGKASTKK